MSRIIETIIQTLTPLQRRVFDLIEPPLNGDKPLPVHELFEPYPAHGQRTLDALWKLAEQQEAEIASLRAAAHKVVERTIPEALQAEAPPVPLWDGGSLQTLGAHVMALEAWGREGWAQRAAWKAKAERPSNPTLPIPAWLSEVEAELQRARAKFPGADHLLHALAEEAGEVTKETLDLYAGKPDASPEKIRRECIQTIAMCVRLMEEGDPMVRLAPLCGGSC